MIIKILTMFPEILEPVYRIPLIRRLLDQGEWSVQIIDIREYVPGSFRHIDDSPYGGGAGMIIRAEPVLKALKSVRTDLSHTVFLTPAGIPYDQKKAHELSEKKELVLICGHYEGIDARILPDVDECISIGDYILSGGETAALVILDSICRLQQGVIRSESIREESFEAPLLEYPQYTHPRVYEGREVPEVLLSGDHEKIRKWRLKEALRVTLKYRPDLLDRECSEEEIQLLKELEEE